MILIIQLLSCRPPAVRFFVPQNGAQGVCVPCANRRNPLSKIMIISQCTARHRVKSITYTTRNNYYYYFIAFYKQTTTLIGNSTRKTRTTSNNGRTVQKMELEVQVIRHPKEPRRQATHIAYKRFDNERSFTNRYCHAHLISVQIYFTCKTSINAVKSVPSHLPCQLFNT